MAYGAAARQRASPRRTRRSCVSILRRCRIVRFGRPASVRCTLLSTTGGSPRPPGWIPNRGTGETMLIQAGGSPAYDGIDRYRVERAGDGLQFVG